MRGFGVLLSCVLFLLTVSAGRLYYVRRMPVTSDFRVKLEWASELTSFAIGFHKGNRFSDYWNFGVNSQDVDACQRERLRRSDLLEQQLKSKEEYLAWLQVRLNIQPLDLEQVDSIERRHSGHWNFDSEILLLTTRCQLKALSSPPASVRREFESGLLALCKRHQSERWNVQNWRLVFYRIFGWCQTRGELLECYQRWRSLAPEQLGWQYVVDNSLVESAPRLCSEEVVRQRIISDLESCPDQPLHI